MKSRICIIATIFTTTLSISTFAQSALAKLQNYKQIYIYQDDLTSQQLGFNNCNSTTNGESFIALNIIKNNDIIFDVGANVGAWSNMIKTRAIQHIYAFEPIPYTFSILQKNISTPNISAFNLAISKFSGTQTFYAYNTNDDTRQMSTFHPRDPKIEAQIGTTRTAITVNTITLDDFCNNYDIKHIHYLKIDTEGHELAVLEGAQQCLQQQSIDFIQFEYGGTYLDAHITLEKVYKLLRTYNYEVFRIVPHGLVYIKDWHMSLENYLYSNYLAVKN